MRKFVAVLLMVTLLTGCGGLRGNSRSYRMQKETQYLADISQPINLGKASDATSKLEKQIRTQNIILTGVVPGVSGNTELQKFFFEAFNGVRKIDYLVVELPYSVGAMINQYLKEDGEQSLERAFAGLEGRPYATEENRSFYRQLKLYLRENNQIIEVVGIDLEYAPEMTLEYLTTVLKRYQTQAFPVTGELIEAQRKGFKQEDYLELSFLNLLTQMREDNELAKSVYGDDYNSIVRVLENLEMIYEKKEEGPTDHFDRDRSDQLVRNFLSIYDKAPESVYFGQLANPAVMQSTHIDYDWFASAIQNERETIKDKVVSLLYTYENCQRMVLIGGRAESVKLDLFKFDDRTMLSAVKQPYTLISLIEKDTIFTDETIIFEKDFEGAVTEYFQYLVILNESPASKTLN